MALTVRLPPDVEKDLAKYCANHGITKSEAVRLALDSFLNSSNVGTTEHSFVGIDEGDGSDVSGNIKAALRAHFRQGNC